MKSPWTTKKLGEICEENIKSPFKVEDVSNSGEYPFFTSGENVLTHDKYLVDGENIFLATGGYANVKYYNGKASYSTDTWSLKVKNALAKFVFYQILARLKYIDEVLFRGSGLRHLQKKEFLNIEIPLPPLPIQQKIVKILDTIQSAVDIQEKIIEKTKELKKSLMAELFKYGAPSFRKGRKLKKTEIGEIPEDWEVVRLGSNIEKPQYGISISATDEDTGVRLLRITDIQEEKVNWNLVPFCKCTKDETEKYQLKEGDLVIARIGATTGKSYFIKNAPKSVFGSYLIRIRAKDSPNSDYLSYYFQTYIYWSQLNLAKGGKLKGGINIPLLENLKLPLPPLPEQQEIAEILQTIDQKIEIEKKKKELYEELFKTMLNKIMGQEINVEKIEV
jgi:type I restriction enzyme S subunit